MFSPAVDFFDAGCGFLAPGIALEVNGQLLARL